MLDIRTVMALTICYSLVIGSAMVYYGFHRKHALGISQIGYGVILTGLGFLILSFRDYLTVFYTVMVSNHVIIIGLILVVHGLTKFRKIAIKWTYIDIMILLILCLTFIQFTYVTPNISARIVIISLVTILYYAEIVWLFAYKLNPYIAKGHWLIGSYFIFAIAISVLRIIVTVMEKPLNSFMTAGFIHSFSVIIYQVMPFILCIGCFWISNALMEEELQTQAMTDSLTNLYNRSAFMRLANNEVRRAERYGFDIGLVMADLDHFKKVNDKYGHLMGDRVLKVVSDVLMNHVRGEDVVARYGGEEFIIMLPIVDKEELKMIMEKLRQVVESACEIVDEDSVCVTMSFGGTILKRDELVIVKGIERADMALYRAKNNGRNRIELMWE